MEIEGYLTVVEAGEILGVTGGRIRQFISEGRLPSIKAGNTRLIKREDLDKLEIKNSGRPKVENRPDQRYRKESRAALNKVSNFGEVTI